MNNSPEDHLKLIIQKLRSAKPSESYMITLNDTIEKSPRKHIIPESVLQTINFYAERIRKHEYNINNKEKRIKLLNSQNQSK